MSNFTKSLPINLVQELRELKEGIQKEDVVGD